VKTYDSGGAGEKLREVPCNLCGSDDPAVFLRGDGFSYVKCRQCGLVYQNPQPVFEDLRKRYGGGYFEYELENDRNFFHLMQLGLRDIGFHERPIGAFDNNCFLDVGCATGMLVQEMQDRGWDAQGVEICEPAARYGREKRGVRIFVGTLEDACFADNSFSVIHFSHLIEHVPNPLGLLSEVKRILTERGTAIVTTPNIRGFQARLFGAQWRSAITDHLTLFSKKTLKRMLERAGFLVVRGVTWGGLAKGTVPGFIKKPADALAKRLGFGDVVLYEAVPLAR
jgi:SAM-dependent methyltransferase